MEIGMGSGVYFCVVFCFVDISNIGFCGLLFFYVIFLGWFVVDVVVLGNGVFFLGFLVGEYVDNGWDCKRLVSVWNFKWIFDIIILVFKIGYID